MRLNKDQREGIAKVTDNLATAFMIAAIVGGLVDKKIGWCVGLLLFSLFSILIIVGIRLRKEGK